MDNEIVRQTIITLGAIAVSMVGLVPAFLKRAQERRTREEREALLRRALDGFSDCLNLLRPLMILESDVDSKIKGEYERLEKEADEAWREYRGRPSSPPEK